MSAQIGNTVMQQFYKEQVVFPPKMRGEERCGWAGCHIRKLAERSAGCHCIMVEGVPSTSTAGSPHPDPKLRIS